MCLPPLHTLTLGPPVICCLLDSVITMLILSTHSMTLVPRGITPYPVAGHLPEKQPLRQILLTCPLHILFKIPLSRYGRVCLSGQPRRKERKFPASHSEVGPEMFRWFLELGSKGKLGADIGAWRRKVSTRTRPATMGRLGNVSLKMC
ncbi:hypothetical protein ElyMa_005629400 [Elysia marginata]|uniref:Uncharacterized protein n=1 Tax=Elysia marginata TaxID=1093978 RepID=A0AAV4FAL7_9GAST|nr:hypothetical protein ElyMa_005629400 [Elysia marginata]